MELLKQLVGIVLVSVLIAGLAGIWAWGSSRNARDREKDKTREKEAPHSCSMGCADCPSSGSCSSEAKK